MQICKNFKYPKWLSIFAYRYSPHGSIHTSSKKKKKKKQLFRDYRRTSEYFVEVNLYQGMRSQLTITKQNKGTQKTNVYKPTQ